jgi:hypothetical protein
VVKFGIPACPYSLLDIYRKSSYHKTEGIPMNNIIDLRETSPNHWQAKYQGNYGVIPSGYTPTGNTGTVFPVPAPAITIPVSIFP